MSHPDKAREIIAQVLALPKYDRYRVAAQAAESIEHDIISSKVLTHCIVLSPYEISSGRDRIALADTLIRQLPRDHADRNEWLQLYGVGHDIDTQDEDAGRLSFITRWFR